MGNQVAAAVVHGSVTKTTRLPDKSSIFRAELQAISLALAAICRSKEKNFIIFSDSMSSLEAISGFKLKIDIVQNIIKDYTHLATVAKQSFCAGYPVMSIFVAMRGLTLQQNRCPITNMKLPACALLPCVSNFCLAEWQDI